MCNNSKQGVAQQGHKDNTKHIHGSRCQSQYPGVLKTDRSSVQVRKVITFIHWRDKLRKQPRLKDHQAHRNSKGLCNRATTTLCLSLDASGASCPDNQSELSTESWKCEEGDRRSTQSLGTASVHRRKGLTYVPVRDKLRSQPGRKDHEAHRNCKGS